MERGEHGVEAEFELRKVEPEGEGIAVYRAAHASQGHNTPTSASKICTPFREAAGEGLELTGVGPESNFASEISLFSCTNMSIESLKTLL